MSKQFPSVRGTAIVSLLLSSVFSAGANSQEGSNADEHHAIEEILVTATPLGRAVEKLAQPTSVLSGNELTKKSSTSIGETVSRELGVTSTYFGPVASRPVIRGQYGERIKVLSNGLDVLDASALSEDHQTSVEGILAERIEIIRGPATMLYGTGASGGLINVVDRRIVESGVQKPIAGEIAVNAASATDERTGAGWVQFGSDNVAVHLDYFRRTTGNVDIPGFAESSILRALEEEEHHEEEEEAFGVVENSDSESSGGAAGVTLNGENGFIGFSVSTFDSNYGVPGGHGHHEEHEEEERGAEEEEEEIVRIDLEQVRVDLTGEYQFNGFIEKARIRYVNNDYSHIEFEGEEIGTRFDTVGNDFRLELTQAATDSLEGVFGLQYKLSEFDVVGDEAFVPATDTERLSLFTFQEFSVTDTLALQGSARVETQEITGSTLPLSYDETAFGASLGAILSLTGDMSIAAHLSLSERHPTSTELYADGPHIAVQRFELGSVTLGDGILEKEISTNFDLTWRGSTERVDWSLTGFINNIDDYIGLLPTNTEEDELQVFEYSQFDADFYGFEAEARIELMHTDRGHLHTRVFSDFVYAERDGGAGEYLPRISPMRVGIGLHYIMDRIELSADVVRFGEQDKTAAGELPTDSYTMVGAEASYSIDDQGLYLFVRGTNLTDEDARQHTSPLKDTVPLPGRSVHAGVRWQF
ncbi:MAG: TonB-dependent receptor [Woeseia sp.]